MLLETTCEYAVQFYITNFEFQCTG